METPSFSCPMIDDALSQIDSAIQVMKDISKEINLPDRFDPSSEITGLELAKANLEGVRSINARLRSYAESSQSEHKDVQKKLEVTERELNDLKFRIAARALVG